MYVCMYSKNVILPANVSVDNDPNGNAPIASNSLQQDRNSC